MTHVVMTRFNVRVEEGAFEPPPETWLRKRIAHFERFTAASMAAQTVQPDGWVIFCDAGSPDWLVTRLERVARLQLVDGIFGADVAAGAVATDDLPLITTRLDNDDAFARDYIEAIQRQAPVEGYVNFIHGVQLFDRRLYRRSDPSNAFISRVEQRSSETVFATPHRLILGRHPLRQVKAPPMWLQLIHDANVANAARGIRTSAATLERFEVQAEATDDGLHLDRIGSAIRLGARVVRRPHRLAWAVRVLRAR